jgi:type IV secretory pathway VirB4 component
LTAFSQHVTDTSLHLSHRVGKLVACDLISYDSLKKQDSTTQSILKMTEEKSRIQDTIIQIQLDKIGIYKNEIKILNQESEEYKKLITKLQKSLKIEKIKSKTFLYSGIGVFVISSLYIITHH